MADRMLSIPEASARGLHPDPFVFKETESTVEAPYPHVCFFESRWFFVIVTEVITADSAFEMTWLSIRRNDRKALNDFRHLQRIKNSLCGPEREAVQLYPAESRLMDAANQTHLWVLGEDERFPWGYAIRDVLTATEARQLTDAGHAVGAAQRAFEEEIEANPRDVDELLADQRQQVHTYHRPKYLYCPDCKQVRTGFPECEHCSHTFEKETL